MVENVNYFDTGSFIADKSGHSPVTQQSWLFFAMNLVTANSTMNNHSIKLLMCKLILNSFCFVIY